MADQLKQARGNYTAGPEISAELWLTDALKLTYTLG